MSTFGDKWFGVSKNNEPKYKHNLRETLRNGGTVFLNKEGNKYGVEVLDADSDPKDDPVYRELHDDYKSALDDFNSWQR